MSRNRKQRLGRGLGALLGEGALDAEAPPGEDGEPIRTLSVSAVDPNPYQPRKEFSEEELTELAESIRENGLLQPLVVRPDPGERDRFQLVAGERRLRAVGRLGWSKVPAVVREIDDRALLVLALVENLQREALGPLEEAEGYRALTEQFELTQGEVAQAVGKDRSTVANMLRLLRLPPSVRRYVDEGSLQMGHARALLSLEDPGRAADLARRAVENEWSVREVEERVRGAGGRRRKGASSPSPRDGADPVVGALEEELRAALGTKARLKGGRSGKGTVEIPFHSPEDFDRIFSLITGREASDVAG